MSDEHMNSNIEQRRGINKNQKAWKYIRDVNGISLKNLNTVAIYDGNFEYKYGQMFREWERYAAVFSNLGMTRTEGSRVGILGSTSAQVLFAVYGLNMTGASVSIVPSYSAFFPHKILDTIKSEKLTDFIVTDDFDMQEIFPKPEIPEGVMKAVLKYGNRISGLSNGRRWIDHDFEE